MSKEQYADKIVHPQTGMPWPIAPRAELPERLPGPGANQNRVADDHHAAEGRDRLKRGTLSDRALRYSRCQWVLYRDHHDGFHQNGMSAQLPDTVNERFRYILFAAALFLPDQSIGFDETKYGLRARIVPLTPRDRQLMWERGDVRVERPLSVNRFLAWQAINSGLTALHTSFDFDLRDRFNKDPEGRAMQFAARLSELAIGVHHLGQDYRTARDQGMLSPAAPSSAKELLVERVQAYQQAHGQSPVAEREPVSAMIARAMQAPIAA